jgi:LysM repeat protein
MRLLGWIVLLGLLGLSACQAQPTPLDLTWPTPTPVSGQLLAYATVTSAPSPTIPPRPTPVFTATPLPSPTPFVHVVKSGETMLGIALQYGVELTALKLANPTVDPLIMSVGTQLVIPLAGSNATPEPTHTPVPLAVQPPACNPMGDGSLWCAVLLKNESAQAVENISLLFDLVDPQGAVLASQVVFPPLNRLPAGGQIGLSAQFPGLSSAQLQPYASLLTASLVGAEQERYLVVEVIEEKISISPGGRQAVFTSQVQVKGSPQTLWVAALGLDAAGNLVGLRKLVFDPACPQNPTETPLPCGPFGFEGYLFSAGPEIARVLILVEARP